MIKKVKFFGTGACSVPHNWLTNNSSVDVFAPKPELMMELKQKIIHPLLCLFLSSLSQHIYAARFLMMIFDKNIPTCERSVIEIGERKNFKDIFIYNVVFNSSL